MKNFCFNIGCDIIEIVRIKKSINHHNEAFLNKIFTKKEREYCEKYKNPYPHYAVRFSAKEAVVKALGTGFNSKIKCIDIEICNDEKGQPYIQLSPSINDMFNSPQFSLSMSHCDSYAMAVVIKFT